MANMQTVFSQYLQLWSGNNFGKISRMSQFLGLAFPSKVAFLSNFCNGKRYAKWSEIWEEDVMRDSGMFRQDRKDFSQMV